MRLSILIANLEIVSARRQWYLEVMIFQTNTTVDMTLIPGRNYAVMAAGTFGSGTLSLTLKDASSGKTLAMPDYASLTTGAAFEFRAPCDRLTVGLAGATSPSLSFTCYRCAI